MSHIVTIQTQIKDGHALAVACQLLGLQPPVEGTATLFAGQVQGLIVHLPGWQFPVVAEPQTGQLHYDNYNGTWGEPVQLNRLLQAYAVEKARLEARRAGHSVTERQLPDGSIHLSIQMRGAA